MSAHRATLVEYETVRLALSGHQARELHATNVVSVTPDLAPGWWAVTAGSQVGTLVAGDVELLIRPKIRPENLFLLLEVGLPPSAWRAEAFAYASEPDLLPSVVAFFARTVETTLARGARHSYREHREREVALRGRIDLVAQFTNPGILVPMACRYDEFTLDIPENRYLKAAVRLAAQVPRVAAEDRRRLLRQLVALEEVSDVVVEPADLDRIVITRLNAHYEPALRLARLLLERLTLVDQRGQTTASSFLVDMNELFERFLRERLRRALRGRLEVRDQPIVHLAQGRKVTMRPDLEFRSRGETRYVADVKYKLAVDARARNTDLYQLLAYATALDLSEGLLVYCFADGGRPERSVTVRHAGTVLHTRTIDLSGPARDVAAEIDELADWIAGRAGRAGFADRQSPRRA